jgi:hypothetical protein
MLEFIAKDTRARLASLLFFLFLLWWLALRLLDKSNIQYQIFSAVYGLMALYGAFVGLNISSHWGGVKSIMGRAILFFSLGLFAQEFGQLAYSAYAFFLRIEIPYPSLGDVGYFMSIPLYALGVWNIAKASGISFSVKKIESKLYAVLIPVLILILAYFFFLRSYQFDWSQPIRIFLDFGYPFGEAVYMSIALVTYVLSRGVLGGIMRNKIFFILYALFGQFLSDYMYLYQSLNQTAHPGSINDLLYLIAYFLMTISLIRFDSALNYVRQSKT